MPKVPKLPACNPCRASKLACDHTRPVCMRCSSRNQSANCTYRSHPFQKIRKPVADVATDSEDSRPDMGIRDTQTGGSPNRLTSLGGHVARPGPMPKRHRYPNPGYLGSSSYTALFGQLPSSIENDLTGDNLGMTQGQGPIHEPVNEAYILHGADLIVQMSRFAQIPTCVRLVKAWVGTQSNLVLASPFTAQCTESAEYLLSGVQEGTRSPAAMSRDLFIHSCRPLTAESSSTSQEFCEQFTGRSSRWETLCLFLTAVSRAAVGLDVSQFSFESEQHRRDMRRLSMHYADRCLDICLSLECPNDLQLILQYENFILHTLVDGDHSFESWRKLGDVVSSLFALGYHQDIEGHSILPPFLRDLRRAAFTNCYSSDKDVSIFLGRPPRISRKFCDFNMLGLGSNGVNEWSPESVFDFTAESRWAAMCAILKEDILELSGVKDMDERYKMSSVIRERAESQWSSLPQGFRLQSSLKSLQRHPVEVDRMLGIKLHHLHVLFLLQLATVPQGSNPNIQLIGVAADMLSLVVEAVMFKGRIVNSGTSLVWKVAYYGLAAAGVICLSLLGQTLTTETRETDFFKVLRDLGVMVAEIEFGTLVFKEDANYALLAGAARTIKNLTSRISLGRTDPVCLQSAGDPDWQTMAAATAPDETAWDPWYTNNLQDFESNFWLTLAEHPLLLGENFPQ